MSWGIGVDLHSIVGGYSGFGPRNYQDLFILLCIGCGYALLCWISRNVKLDNSYTTCLTFHCCPYSSAHVVFPCQFCVGVGIFIQSHGVAPQFEVHFQRNWAGGGEPFPPRELFLERALCLEMNWVAIPLKVGFWPSRDVHFPIKHHI